MIMPSALCLRDDELIVDSFAGGGGASLGIEMALGRSPDIAINHDAEAIAMHKANHPRTTHYCEDAWRVNPIVACGGRPVGLFWASPDCTHHSKARGAKPRKKKIRGLAWVVVRWAAAVRPRIIGLENVEEFQDWGPLLPNDRPDPVRKGKTFRAFVAKLRRLGYEVQWHELRASHYDTPTIRKRLFLVARCDGLPIVWPRAETGLDSGNPVRIAAECIDWTIPCPSIFSRKKPLVTNTLRRVARGTYKFVIDNPRPFIVSLTHHGSDRVESIDAPFNTITGAHRGEKALCVPMLVPRYGEREGQAPRVRSIEEPFPTIVPTQNGAQLVAAFLAKHYTERKDSDVNGASLFDPMPTVTSVDHNAVVAAHIVKLKGTSRHGQPIDEPLHTVQAGGTHYAQVCALLVAYYGNEMDGGSLFDPMRTVTSKDRFGLILVRIRGADYCMVDIGMRMLVARELFRAQGFPDSYKIDIPFTRTWTTKNGKVRSKTAPLSKTAQTRMCGNSVCPKLARAIVVANVMGFSPVQVAA